jgi:hypothetical protein
MSGSYAYHSGDVPGLTGAYHYGDGGLGILGSLIPSSGDSGPSYLFASLSLPADANKEYYGPLGTLPSGLTISVDENGAVTAAANDGTYVVPFDLYENGVKLGSTSFTLNYGAVASTINLAGANSSESSTSSTGAATATPASAGTVNLVGANASETSTSSAGSATVTPAAQVINLIGANGTETSTTSTAAATVTPAAKTVSLTASSTDETSTSSTGLVLAVTPPLSVNPRMMYVAGSMANFHPKRAAEREVFTVDFSPILAAGEAITSAVWSITAVDGSDPSASAMVSGEARPNGALVSQFIMGGVPGVVYAPVCTAQTSEGQALVLPEYGAGLLEVTL